jgi:hypothetical protein
MNSETYDGEMVVGRQPSHAGSDRCPTRETRYPHSAMPSARTASSSARSANAAIPSTGRLRAGLLIVFAIIALSAFAAIGWMQYQSDGGSHDPQIEISAPDRSVPALADAAGGS